MAGWVAADIWEAACRAADMLAVPCPVEAGTRLFRAPATPTVITAAATTGTATDGMAMAGMAMAGTETAGTETAGTVAAILTEVGAMADIPTGEPIPIGVGAPVWP